MTALRRTWLRAAVAIAITLSGITAAEAICRYCGWAVLPNGDVIGIWCDETGICYYIIY